MKEIKLSYGKFALVDDTDYEWLNQWKWCAIKQGNTFYASRSAKNNDGSRSAIRMHRQILGIIDRNVEVDHKDHNGLNNQRSNIRLCNRCQNAQNQQVTGRGSSKYKGVSRHKKKNVFYASIKANHKQGRIGRFFTEESAALAYNEAAKKYHGDFACLNIIEPIASNIPIKAQKTNIKKRCVFRPKGSKSLPELRRIYKQWLRANSRSKGESIKANLRRQIEDYFEDWLKEISK